MIRFVFMERPKRRLPPSAAIRPTQNRRRLLVTLVGVTVFGRANGQLKKPSSTWRVGFLSPRSRPASLHDDIYGAFVKGMHELGYVTGKNLVIEWRFANNNPDRLDELVADLKRLKVHVIVTPGAASTRAAQRSITDLPVVFINPGDPVQRGLVKSLARPGGNLTGLANLQGDYGTKHVEMLLSIAPKLRSVAVLMLPNADDFLHQIQATAEKIGIEILPLVVRDNQEIEEAFTVMGRERAGGLIIIQSPLFLQYRHRIAELAAKGRLPSISSYREFPEVGLLMSYGQNNSETYRRAATYVDKILKGAKPGELPVELPMRFELVINSKTAKTLGLAIPQSLLISAEQLIE